MIRSRYWKCFGTMYVCITCDEASSASVAKHTEIEISLMHNTASTKFQLHPSKSTGLNSVFEGWHYVSTDTRVIELSTDVMDHRRRHGKSFRTPNPHAWLTESLSHHTLSYIWHLEATASTSVYWGIRTVFLHLMRQMPRNSMMSTGQHSYAKPVLKNVLNAWIHLEVTSLLSWTHRNDLLLDIDPN